MYWFAFVNETVNGMMYYKAYIHKHFIAVVDQVLIGISK